MGINTKNWGNYSYLYRQSCTYSHEQNDRINHKYCHIIETMIALFVQFYVSSKF